MSEVSLYDLPIASDAEKTKAFCSCGICIRQYIPPLDQQTSPTEQKYWATLNLGQATRCAKSYLENIQRDRQFLIEQLASKGNTIFKRWSTTAKRKRYLEETKLDGVPAEMFSHLYTLYDDDYIREKNRKGLLVPSPNVELLESDPHCFFALLHNRTKYSPQDFAAQDSQELSFAWDNNLARVEYSETCICMHSEAYGELKPWDEGVIHLGTHMAFPRGKLVFEAQEHILSCLRKLVETILKGVPSGTADAAATWIRESTLGFQLYRGGNILPTYFSGVCSEPIVVDFGVLASVAKFLRRAAASYIRDIQTNPQNMHDTMDKMDDPGRDGLFTTIFEDLEHDLLDNIMWDTIENRLDRLGVLGQRLQESPKDPNLQSEYGFSLSVLELLLIRYFQYSGQSALHSLRHAHGFDYIFSSVSKEVRHRGWTSLQYTWTQQNHTWLEALDNAPMEWCLSKMLSWEPIYKKDDPDGFKANGRVDFVTLKFYMCDLFYREDQDENSKVRRRWATAKYLALHHILETLRCHKPLIKSCEIEVDTNNVVTKVKGLNKLPPELNPSKLYQLLEAPEFDLMSDIMAKMRAFDKKSGQGLLDKLWSAIRLHNTETLEYLDFDPALIADHDQLLTATSQPECIAQLKALHDAQEASLVSTNESTPGPTDPSAGPKKPKKRRKGKGKSQSAKQADKHPQQDQISQQDEHIEQD